MNALVIFTAIIVGAAGAIFAFCFGASWLEALAIYSALGQISFLLLAFSRGISRDLENSEMVREI